MASLANQTISSTYDGLIKTSTDDAVPASGVQLLEDGSGNSLAISIGRANNGVTVTGTVTATAFVGDGSGLTGISVSPTLDEVTTNGATTTNSITVGNVTATSFIKSGGTSAQFLKADGTVDSSTYLTSFTETNDLTAAVVWANVPDANITQTSVTQHQAALSITESQISDLQAYLTAESDTLDSVTGRGATTTNAITVGGISITGTLLDSNGQAGTSGQVLSSTATGIDWVDAAAGGVTSVNGQTGVVSLALSDLTDVSSATPSDGQVLTYDTVNGWQPETVSGGGGGTDYTVQEISTNTTAVKDNLYVLTASLTLTLPASPSVGDKVAVSNMSGTLTPVVARNGELIGGVAEDLTIDADSVSVEFIYSGATKGWVLFVDGIAGADAGGGGTAYTIQEISTNTTAVKDNLYVLTASLTLTLPASPSVGDKVALSNMSDTITPVVARNGNLILGLAEDLTINVKNLSVEFIYSGATEGWIVFTDTVLGYASTSTVDGTGTTNYISKWSDADTLTDSVIYDDGSKIAIGGNVAYDNLSVELSSATAYSNGVGSQGLTLYNNSATTGQFVGITFSGTPTSGNDGVATILGTTTGNGSMDLTFSTRSSAVLTEKMRILAGGGITFNGDTAAANALDDYEEGTFTPTAQGASSAGTTTYIYQNGLYTKIGRQVNIHILIGWSSLTGTGDLIIGGVPFTPLNSENINYLGGVLTDGLNWNPNGSCVVCELQRTTGNIVLVALNDDQSLTQAQQCVNETAYVRVTLTYYTS